MIWLSDWGIAGQPSIVGFGFKRLEGRKVSFELLLVRKGWKHDTATLDAGDETVTVKFPQAWKSITEDTKLTDVILEAHNG